MCVQENAFSDRFKIKEETTLDDEAALPREEERFRAPGRRAQHSFSQIQGHNNST